MRDQHVCQRKKRSSSIYHTHTPLLICFHRELSLTTPRHAVMSYRWVRCAIQYTRQTTTQCHWGLGGQQTSKQQATNKQANTKSAVDHINILFVSFIHTYKSIINGENHHHHHQHHRLTKLLSVIEVVVVVRLEWY